MKAKKHKKEKQMLNTYPNKTVNNQPKYVDYVNTAENSVHNAAEIKYVIPYLEKVYGKYIIHEATKDNAKNKDRLIHFEFGSAIIERKADTSTASDDFAVELITNVPEHKWIELTPRLRVDRDAVMHATWLKKVQAERANNPQYRALMTASLPNNHFTVCYKKNTNKYYIFRTNKLQKYVEQNLSKLDIGRPKFNPQNQTWTNILAYVPLDEINMHERMYDI